MHKLLEAEGYSASVGACVGLAWSKPFVSGFHCSDVMKSGCLHPSVSSILSSCGFGNGKCSQNIYFTFKLWSPLVRSEGGHEDGTGYFVGDTQGDVQWAEQHGLRVSDLLLGLISSSASPPPKKNCSPEHPPPPPPPILLWESQCLSWFLSSPENPPLLYPFLCYVSGGGLPGIFSLQV